MTYVALDRTKVKRPFNGSVFAKDTLDDAGFNGISNGGTSTVSLDISRFSRIKTNSFVSYTSQVRLGFFARHGHTLCSTILIDTSIADHRSDGIPISNRVVERL